MDLFKRNSFIDETLLNHIDTFDLEHRQFNTSFYKTKIFDDLTLTSSMSPIDFQTIDNCTRFFSQVRNNYENSIGLINLINYFIISIGIFFNILNLIVLLNSKLNESPYTYLTMLALSDLGALFMMAFENLRHSMIPKDKDEINIYIDYIFLFVIIPLTNIFLSCSMYCTLALTIERFIFVHSPFKAMTICHRSIARRVCFGVFVFSVLRFVYLPFVYEKNKCMPGGFFQQRLPAIDVFEFLISLAIPYVIIFIVNISLIFSLNKQNSLMSLTRNQSFLFTNYPNNNSNPNMPVSLAARFRRNSSASVRTTINHMETQRLFEEKETNMAKPIQIVRQSSIDSQNDQFNTDNTNSNRVLNPTTASITTTTTNTTRNSEPVCTIPNLVESLIKQPCKLYHRTFSTKEMRNQKKLTTSLIMILCSLIICYAPSFLFEESLADKIFGELNYYDQSEESARLLQLRGIGFRISLLLIYINCSLNFLIYCISNKKFKNSLKSLIKRSFVYNYFQTKKSCFNTKKQIGTIKYTMKRNESRNWHELIILNRTAEPIKHLSSRATSISTRLTNSLRSSCENTLGTNMLPNN